MQKCITMNQSPEDMKQHLKKIARFQTEKDALSKRHQKILANGDPYYNPNLTHDKEDFALCRK